jgi:hypothetical protein
MTGNPSDIGHACKLVFRVNVEDVLDGEQSTEKVATGGVDDTLGLSGRTRSLEIVPVSMSDDESHKSAHT